MTELEPQFLEVVSTSAAELRQAFMPFQAGVMDSGDLKVTAAGGTREVSVAAGVAFVKGSATDQGNYRIRNDAAKSSLAFDTPGLPANASGNPRLDQIIARILDHVFDGSGLRRWRLEYAQGTPNAATTLDTRTGAVSDVSLGSNWLRLADVLVPNGATTISVGNIRDRRLWARGGFRTIVRTAGDYTINSGTFVEVDATNLKPRLECSGLPVKMTLQAILFNGTGAAGSGIPGTIALLPLMDGLAALGTAVVGGAIGANNLNPERVTMGDGFSVMPSLSAVVTPAAGSHLFSWAWTRDVAATMSMRASTSQPLVLTVEEVFRQNADNT